MYLNDLLNGRDIDPQHVIVFRHRPWETELNKVLPWLAAERPEVYNAYQQTQTEKVERALQSLPSPGYVASFIRRSSGQALFVGLYSIAEAKPITRKEYWAIPANIE